MTLGDYLAAAGRAPWRDGAHDCCTFPADWVIARGWPDPMARWRGSYSTARGARAIVRKAGGMVALWEAALGELGVAPAPEPQEGDVGVVEFKGGRRKTDVGAIFTGKRWVLLAPRGLVALPLGPEQVLKAWRPCPR